MAAGVQLERAWTDVVAETTGWLLVSHQVGLIMMVGGKVPSTMSLEKAMILPSVPDGLEKDTGSRSTPQSTRKRRGGPATTVSRAGLSSRASEAQVLR